MRTTTQIENLRRALSLSLGPIAFMFSDKEIDDYANRLQDYANNLPVDENFLWIIFTKLEGDQEFTQEPNGIYCSLKTIQTAVLNLLEKYKKLVEIKIESETGECYHYKKDKTNAS